MKKQTFYLNMFPLFKPLAAVGFCCWIVVAGGCASSIEKDKRFFWPPADQNPKIEYLNFYQSDVDIRREKSDLIVSWVLGETVPHHLFDVPFDVASNGQGKIVVSDVQKKKILVLDLSNFEVRSLEDKSGGEFLFKLPMGVALASDGSIYVVDKGRRVVFKFGPDEKLIKAFGANGELKGPTGIAVNQTSGQVYVADTANHDIVVFNPDGRMTGRIGERGMGGGRFNYPLAVDVDNEGRIYVLDTFNGLIQLFDNSGQFVRSFGGFGVDAGFFRMGKGIAVGPQDLVYVTDARANRMTVFNNEGQLLTTIGGESSSASASGVHPGGFLMPGGVDVDNQGGIWVVDSLNGMVHNFQYLTDAYLEANPIMPGQVYLPSFMKEQSEDAK